MERPHQPGDIVADRYRIVSLLGEGGSSRTYEAEDLQSNKRLALKALSLKGMSDWKALELFEREAKILAELNHIAIPRYWEYFHIDSPSNRAFYIAQELAPGESLAALVEKGWRANEEEVRRIGAELLEILVYLHDLTPAVIHRDIKPQNIIRAEDGRIFLVDFGAVRQSYQTTMARGSTVVGTFGYMAPEQFIGQAFEATDLYCLGATLLFLLTHRSPADLPVERLKINFRDRVKISSSFADWLEEMLEPDIEERFSSAKEALSALRSKSETAAAKSSPLPWKALVGVGVAAVAVVTIVNSFKWAILGTLGLTPRRICEDISVVESYLKQGGNPNAIIYNFQRRNFRFRTSKPSLLHCVSRFGSQGIAELLIAKGADVNAKDGNTGPAYSGNWKYGNTPLHWAAYSGNREVAELLIAKGADVNALNNQGQTPLHQAALQGNWDIVELLVAQGANINAKYGAGYYKNNETILHWTARKGILEIAEPIVAQGANVNALDEEGQTPLHDAASNGNWEIAELLIAKGANVNARDKSGKTPLYRAVRKRNLEIAELLIVKGANFYARNKYVKTLLHWAVTNDKQYTVELLIAKGVDVNARHNYSGETPLHKAAGYGKRDMAKLLIAEGADVNARDKDGETPLHHAARNGKLEMLEPLVAKGADVNALDEKGQTPLHQAASNGNLEVADILIAEGANVNARDNSDETPLDVAMRKRRMKMIKLLKSYGGR